MIWKCNILVWTLLRYGENYNLTWQVETRQYWEYEYFNPKYDKKPKKHFIWREVIEDSY